MPLLAGWRAPTGTRWRRCLARTSREDRRAPRPPTPRAATPAAAALPGPLRRRRQPGPREPSTPTLQDRWPATRPSTGAQRPPAELPHPREAGPRALPECDDVVTPDPLTGLLPRNDRDTRKGRILPFRDWIV